jgi:hypothetical protein
MENPSTVANDIELESLSAGVDYLTITVQSEVARRDLYTRALDGIETNGGDATVKPWSFKGYKGLRCEGLSWGTREDSDICMLSGYDAASGWEVFLPVAEGISRVDLQVTTTVANPIPGLTQTYYDWLVENKRDLSFRKFVLLTGSDAGSTLYIGSRLSDQFGRIYDKGVEGQLGTPAGKVWRFEVEFKNARAGRVAEQLRSYVGPERVNGNAVRERILSTAKIWFSARECPVLWQADAQPMLLDVVARITGDDILLKWLSTQVRPSIGRLTSRGKQNEALEALGLHYLIQEERPA